MRTQILGQPRVSSAVAYINNCFDNTVPLEVSPFERFILVLEVTQTLHFSFQEAKAPKNLRLFFCIMFTEGGGEAVRIQLAFPCCVATCKCQQR